MKKLKANLISKSKESRLYQIPVPIIGLTGGIATGKSTVAQLFREMGIPVIDADKLVKAIYGKASSIEFVKTHFPSAVEGEVILFKTLRELAFNTPANQKKIEEFIYAQMPEAFKKAFSELPKSDVVVYDVPLLFEKNLNDSIDVSLCVYTPESIQVERLIKRDHIESALAKTILSKQMNIEEKKKKSQFVISNIGSMSDLKIQFDFVCHQIFESH